MITEAILKFLGALGTFLLGLLPTVTLPAWLTSASSTLADAVAFIPLAASNWFPLQAIGHGITFILACSAIALGIRFARIAVSMFTGGGGSAA